MLRSPYLGYVLGQIILVQFVVIRCTLQNSDVKKFQNATVPIVFIQLQPNFVESMVIMGDFDDLTKLKKNFMEL